MNVSTALGGEITFPQTSQSDIGVAIIENKPVVAAFDFDVTLTTKDTFVPFLYRAFGKSRVRKVFAKLAPEAIKVLLGFSNRDRFKELLVHALFLGESVERLKEEGEKHAEQVLGWIRPAAFNRIRWHKSRGDRLVMVSASIGLYLEHVVAVLEFDDLLCTNPSVNQLVFDGGLVGKNCRGPEKVDRLRNLIGDLSKYDLYAYGDSEGDKELLEAANYPNYRVFE